MFATIAGRLRFPEPLVVREYGQAVAEQSLKFVAGHFGRPEAAFLMLLVHRRLGHLAVLIDWRPFVGTDFCRPMLILAAKKTSRSLIPIPFIEGDASESTVQGRIV